MIFAQLCSRLQNYFLKKVIGTIYMPDSILFFTAYSAIPDINNNNNNNTDESQTQIPTKQRSYLFIFLFWAICVCWRMEDLGYGLGVGWWGELLSRGGEEEM